MLFRVNILWGNFSIVCRANYVSSFINFNSTRFWKKKSILSFQFNFRKFINWPFLECTQRNTSRSVHSNKVQSFSHFNCSRVHFSLTKNCTHWQHYLSPLVQNINWHISIPVRPTLKQQQRVHHCSCPFFAPHFLPFFTGTFSVNSVNLNESFPFFPTSFFISVPGAKNYTLTLPV